MSIKSSISNLIKNNKKWAASELSGDPNYFNRLVNIQSPKFLWIGCSDSRVPPDKITQTQPGEIFIHRNVANLVLHTDMNLLSVVQYAVYVLKVEHIIICGHYNCGGVAAALSKQSFGLIDNWLRNIKDVYRIHKKEIDEIKDEKLKLNKLIELNIQEQVYNLSKTNLIQSYWKDNKIPEIHGWVYNLNDGIIKELLTVNSSQFDKNIEEFYKYDEPRF